MKILEKSGQEFEIVEYINSPPSPTELKTLAEKMGIRARDFIRSKETAFKEHELKLHLDNDLLLFKHMSENPKLIERPIVVKGDKAALCRPPERVLELIN